MMVCVMMMMLCVCDDDVCVMIGVNDGMMMMVV